MKYLFFSLFLSLMLVSCANSANDNLTEAEACLNMGDAEGARRLCYNPQDTAKIDFTPSQLCRQAIIYARLSEMCDNQDDMALASQYYALAVDMNPDSVSVFISGLSVDDLARMRIIRDLNQALEYPFDYSDDFDFEADSIAMDSIYMKQDSTTAAENK